MAIIDVGDISDTLDYRRVIAGESEHYSVAMPKALWPGAEYHVALLLNRGQQIEWLGRAQGRRSVSDRDRRIEITEITQIEQIALTELQIRLPKRHKNSVQVGILSDAAGRAIRNVLLQMKPNLGEILDALGRRGKYNLPRGGRGLTLNEQRDGVGLLLDVAGVGKNALASMRPMTRQQSSFLESLPPRTVSEEAIIDHDIARLYNLPVEPSGHVDWRIFSGHGRRLFVSNINMEPLEKTLGVDVIYYNETYQSFVLVQYKRMVKGSSSEPHDDALWYRPDKHLTSELERMRDVDTRYGQATGDFRLFGGACWMKLCDPSAIIKDPRELIKGMYLAREYFVELLGVCKGPNGGVRMGYDNIDRYINNTTFIQLVRDGWIGTRGSGTDQLKSVVQQVLASRRSVVLGVTPQ